MGVFVSAGMTDRLVLVVVVAVIGSIVSSRDAINRGITVRTETGTTHAMRHNFNHAIRNQPDRAPGRHLDRGHKFLNLVPG